MSMDPGFRCVLLLLELRDEHRKLGHLLPDWPQAIKDRHDALGTALGKLNGALWDMWVEEARKDAEGPENPGKDATVATHDCAIPDPESRDEPPGHAA